MRPKLSMTIAVVATITAGAAGVLNADDQNAGGNLLRNGSFESGALSPWVDYGSHAQPETTTVPPGGKSAICLANGAGVAYQAEQLKPGTKYRFSVTVEVDKDDNKVRLSAYKFDSDNPDATVDAMIDLTKWQNAAIEFTTGKKDTTAMLCLWKDEGQGTGSAYGSQFSLVEVK